MSITNAVAASIVEAVLALSRTSRPQARDLASTILGRLAEPQRYYHTATHIHALIQLAAPLQLSAPECHLWTLAAAWHDVVYWPTRSDNEAASKQLWETHASDCIMEPAVQQWVGATIDATAGHCLADADQELRLPSHLSPRGPALAAWFLDADVAILGVAEPRYMEYADQIRQEYSHVPPAAYTTGRASVLTQLASHPLVARTEPMELSTQAAVSAIRAWAGLPTEEPAADALAEDGLSPFQTGIFQVALHHSALSNLELERQKLLAEAAAMDDSLSPPPPDPSHSV